MPVNDVNGGEWDYFVTPTDVKLPLDLDDKWNVEWNYQTRQSSRLDRAIAMSRI